MLAAETREGSEVGSGGAAGDWRGGRVGDFSVDSVGEVPAG
jgi:hypothetical protein